MEVASFCFAIIVCLSATKLFPLCLEQQLMPLEIYFFDSTPMILVRRRSFNVDYNSGKACHFVAAFISCLCCFPEMVLVVWVIEFTQAAFEIAIF
jgi:hypothetical protein